MAIKSRIDKLPKNVKYPQLMHRPDGIIVLMSDINSTKGLGTGVTVWSTVNDMPVGQYSTFWGISEFLPYYGAVTLENE